MSDTLAQAAHMTVSQGSFMKSHFPSNHPSEESAESSCGGGCGCENTSDKATSNGCGSTSSCSCSSSSTAQPLGQERKSTPSELNREFTLLTRANEFSQAPFLPMISSHLRHHVHEAAVNLGFLHATKNTEAAFLSIFHHNYDPETGSTITDQSCPVQEGPPGGPGWWCGPIGSGPLPPSFPPEPGASIESEYDWAFWKEFYLESLIRDIVRRLNRLNTEQESLG